jgi:hypothetical protein
VIAQHGLDRTVLLADAPEAFTGVRTRCGSLYRLRDLVLERSVFCARRRPAATTGGGESGSARISRAGDAEMFWRRSAWCIRVRVPDVEIPINGRVSKTSAQEIANGEVQERSS